MQPMHAGVCSVPQRQLMKGGIICPHIYRAYICIHRSIAPGRNVKPHAPPPIRAAAAAFGLLRHRPTSNQTRRSHACHCSAEPSGSQADDQYGASWQKLLSLKRDMNAAATAEDFALAARLRDESKELLEQLPPVQQYLFFQIDKLKSGSSEEQQQALLAIGEAGDSSLVPELVPYLRVRQLQQAATAAMVAIFHRSRNPRVNELMGQGIRLMGAPSNAGLQPALELFAEIIQLEPEFAEGYNKRATVLFLLKQHQESIEECKRVLQLQPHHFGAASGLGLCYAELGRIEEAIEAFTTALNIHPGLAEIEQYREKLQRRIDQGSQPGS